MIKAVNMKGYYFGERKNMYFNGFGILDTETNTFVSHNGKLPFVLERKKWINGCIESGYQDAMPQRVDYATKCWG